MQRALRCRPMSRLRRLRSRHVKAGLRPELGAGRQEPRGLRESGASVVARRLRQPQRRRQCRTTQPQPQPDRAQQRGGHSRNPWATVRPRSRRRRRGSPSPGAAAGGGQRRAGASEPHRGDRASSPRRRRPRTGTETTRRGSSLARPSPVKQVECSGSLWCCRHAVPIWQVSQVSGRYCEELEGEHGCFGKAGHF